ncbi:helix-turn-helix domain-containing protein [Bombilactobacillus folatiphilus]|uniref:Helix-turn-helix domain-containing protein n=1 Tax=Bombilactobacillus folatiphilus TaxID=2923362 RepID=A0ABY4PA33_9LACO|nr:helix-turn-helix transcriptional regulator [Bombilactobacillus folatiphilus]UQS82257.1 helix-turn-helix domain-containing protein [Bombilactobacillus folatiphilus]
MLNYESEIEQRLGQLIKDQRCQLQMSQHELAEGICSQSMVSSIEHGSYIPNALLFLKLCHRLNIHLDDSFLKSELILNSSATFSKDIFALCKQHKYAEMLSYLNEESVLDSLNTTNDLQTYYYYYGCAIYQLKHSAVEAKRYFQIASLYSHDQGKKRSKPAEVEILILNATAVVEMQLGHTQKALGQFTEARQNLDLSHNSSENLNVIDYQYGLALYKLEKYPDALAVLLAGYDRIRQIESYFMLPEYALMIMNCYQHLGNNTEVAKYKAHYDVFADVMLNKNDG